MTQASQVGKKTQNKQVLFISKATTWVFFLYASLASFVINIAFLPGHVILLPYYLIAMFARGKAPNFLAKWVQFNSRRLFRVKTIEGETCRNFWCLYFIYGGFIINFVFWIVSISFLGLIVTVFLFIEEWAVITNFIYRLSFGYWGKIINKPPGAETTDSDVKSTVVAEEIVESSKAKGKKKLSSCPVCGVEIEKETQYCPKCGSLIEG
jgi:hypothetical protein